MLQGLEIFVITNGRSTFEYTMRSIEHQSVKCPVTIIRDMKWVDALNKCVDLCKSEFFLRIDDDMFLHQYAVAYYYSKLRKLSKKKIGVYVCRLWEEWSNKPVNGLRLYSHVATKKLGFHVSKLGKVDKVFKESLKKIGMVQVKNPSIVGIHSLSPIEDQIKYRNLWRDKNSKLPADKFAQTFDNKIHPFNKSLDRQFLLLNKMRKINSRFNTEFLEFILRQRETEYTN